MSPARNDAAVPPWLDHRTAPNGCTVRENFAKWFRKSKAVDSAGAPLMVHHGTNDAGFGIFDATKIDAHHIGFFFTSSDAVAESYGSHAAVEIRTAPALKTVSALRRHLEAQSPFEGHHLRILDRQQVLDDETDAPRIYHEYVLYWEGSSGFREIGEYRPHLQRGDLQRMVDDAIAALAKGPSRSGMYSVYLSLQKPLIVDAGGAPWMAITFENMTSSISGISGIAQQRGYDGLIVRNTYDSNVVLDTASDIFVAFSPEQIKSATDNNGNYDRRNPSLTDATHEPLRRAHLASPKGMSL